MIYVYNLYILYYILTYLCHSPFPKLELVLVMFIHGTWELSLLARDSWSWNLWWLPAVANVWSSVPFHCLESENNAIKTCWTHKKQHFPWHVDFLAEFTKEARNSTVKIPMAPWVSIRAWLPPRPFHADHRVLRPSPNIVSLNPFQYTIGAPNASKMYVYDLYDVYWCIMSMMNYTCLILFDPF